MTLFKKVLSSDTLYTFMTIVNDSLTIIENLLTSITNFVDVDNKKIKNVTKVEIFNGVEDTPKPELIGLSTNQSVKSLGDGYFSGKISSKSLDLTNSGGLALNVNSGNVNLGDSSSLLDINGNVNFMKRLSINSYSTSFNANQKANYYIGSTPNFTDDGGVITGNLSMLGSSAKILNFTSYSSGNADLNVRHVKLLCESTLPIGSIAIISVIVPPAHGTEFILDKSTILCPTGAVLTKGIVFVNSYSSVILLSTTDGWIPISLTGCTLS